jgi:hypothetical protein
MPESLDPRIPNSVRSDSEQGELHGPFRVGVRDLVDSQQQAISIGM